MTANPAQVVPVLIVGAGPVGLTLAIELGLRGIECVLVEQRDGRLRVPRMSQVSVRNMEFCRRWGIADKVRGAVWSSTHPLDFVYAASLTGPEIARLKLPSYARQGSLDYSPEGGCTCPQIFFDPILAETARSLPKVTLRYRTRLDSFAQDGAGVHARLTDLASGQETTLSAQYMVGCDGAGGTVRPLLDIPLDGLGTIATSVNIFFRSPELASLHDKGWARFYRMIDDGGCWSELIAIDGRELWRLTVFHHEGPTIESDAYLRKMAGRDFAYEVIDTTAWERRDCVARSYRRGRVLIAGDTAHQSSPTGGVGMHAGVCEAVNLAWKLEALFKGWGGPRLLDSYESECRPIAEWYVELSTGTFDALTSLPGGMGMRDTIVADKGILRRLSMPDQLRAQFCYEASPICVADGTPPPWGDARLAPSARPGTRAPHGWIADGKSTLDLFGDGFVLLRLGGAADDAEPLCAAASARGVPFRVADIDRPEIARLFERRLVLVRPDAHIAWRGDALPADPAALIDRVRGA
jgi:2-polyprenyl-6-methoxyphenol hydroxylase-like FAD-dependent oxidoreductase